MRRDGRMNVIAALVASGIAAFGLVGSDLKQQLARLSVATGPGGDSAVAGGGVPSVSSSRASVRAAMCPTVYNSDTQSLYEVPGTGTGRFLEDWVIREVSYESISTRVQDAAPPDICLHGSKVGEVFVHRCRENLNQIQDSYYRNGMLAIRALRPAETDILRAIVAVLKEHGSEILPGIRMSESHHGRIDLSEPLCPLLTIRNPGWVIRQPDRRTHETAMGCSVPEVRAHRLAIITEIAEQYDLDGVEWNVNRWAKHFPRHLRTERAPIMTEHVGTVRRTLDTPAGRRGRSRLVLGVRVPEGIRQCCLAGLDRGTWVKQAWIDYLVVAPYNESSPQIAVQQFAAFTKGRCQLLVATSDQAGGLAGASPTIQGRRAAQIRTLPGYQGMRTTDAEALACALNHHTWGAAARIRARRCPARRRRQGQELAGRLGLRGGRHLLRQLHECRGEL